MRSRLPVLGLPLLVATLAIGQEKLDPGRLFRIDFPNDSPLSLVVSDWGESTATARGGAVALDLHATLSLRNSSQHRIRAVTLQVLAQEVTPGGKASRTIASLDVPPGEVFPARIDLRLLRPLGATGGALVQVTLDGVLYEDLSFYGPNKLNSRRLMTAYEMEARRDRDYFKSVLHAKGPEGLQREILSTLSAESSRFGVQLARGGRATNVEAEHEVQFAFLQFPDSPVEPLDGLARVSGNEARAPRLEVKNRSDRAIRYLEIGWIVQDQKGHNYLAGSVPADLNLGPGEKAQVLENASLKFSQKPGQPLSIQGITGFVSSVEYKDGKVWVPSRVSLAKAQLRDVLGPSPEEQRLVQIYRKRGLAALVEELKKF